MLIWDKSENQLVWHLEYQYIVQTFPDLIIKLVTIAGHKIEATFETSPVSHVLQTMSNVQHFIMLDSGDLKENFIREFISVPFV